MRERRVPGRVERDSPGEARPLAGLCLQNRAEYLTEALLQEESGKRNSAYDVAMEELEDCLPASGSVEEEAEARELARVIEQFLDTLSDENSVIFLRRYWFSDPYAEIAERTGISEKSVSMRLVRIRKQMRQYLMEREVYV